MNRKFKFYFIVICCFLLVTMLCGFISSGASISIKPSGNIVAKPSIVVPEEKPTTPDTFGGVLFYDALSSIDNFEKTSSPTNITFNTRNPYPVSVSKDDLGITYYLPKSDTDDVLLDHVFMEKFDVSSYDYAVMSYSFNLANYDEHLTLEHTFATKDVDIQSFVIPKYTFTNCSNYDYLNVDYVFKFNNSNYSCEVLVYVNDEFLRSYFVDFNEEVAHVYARIYVFCCPSNDISLTLNDFFIHTYGSGDGSYSGSLSKLFDNHDVLLSDCVDSIRYKEIENEN